MGTENISCFFEGETIEDVQKVTEKYVKEGIRFAVDHSTEEAGTEKFWEENCVSKIELVERCSKIEGVSFVPLKITALGSPHLLEEITELLYRDEFSLGGKEVGEDFEERVRRQLSGKQEKELGELLWRVERIVKAAVEKRVSILLDAEQTPRQLAIHWLSLLLISKYNSSPESPSLLYNTYQCYLKETPQILNAHLHYAQKKGFLLGAKVVRGAYVDHENLLASSLGRPSPLFPTKQATDEAYNESLHNSLSFVSQNCASLVIGTHNELSVQLAVERMEELKVRRDTPHVNFGTLFGMCDNLAFALAQGGYRPFKLIPYGKIDVVFPYLLRRLQENASMLSGTRKERQLLLKEIQRRAKK